VLRAFFSKNLIEAGCDEAGHGCLAGPVTAGAVILPPKYRNKELNDSKLLSKKQRDRLRIEIEREALAWSVGWVKQDEIDTINILNASFLAMHRALDGLKQQPEHLLIDGNRFNPYQNIPHQCIIKGDSKYYTIAAASILAKTHRDELMQQLALEFPDYHWHTNVGYPTQEHREAIKDHGITPYHRKSFQLLPRQLALFE